VRNCSSGKLANSGTDFKIVVETVVAVAGIRFSRLLWA
jgi:hypothetical protein